MPSSPRRIDPASLATHGRGLVRPECVLATAAGDLFVSHFQGGIARLTAAGGQEEILGRGRPRVATNGFALAAEGDFLCANLLPSGGVWRVRPDGTQELILEDADPAWLYEVERAFQAGEMDWPHLDRGRSERLGNISSLAFGGPDLCRAYLGNLLDDKIYSFQSPVAGLRPVHWDFRF